MTREDITQVEIDDDRIKRMVMEAIAWDPRTHYTEVNVAVDGGVVFLSGLVESSKERSSAEEDAARIPGITLVINNIVAKNEFLFSDEDILQNVKETLLRDPRLDERHFEITVENSVVTLRGDLVTTLEKQAAVNDVRLVDGVEQVVDEISVLPEQASNDLALEELVTASLVRAPNVNERDIHAHVKDGTVYLRGVTDFEYQKQEMEQIAKEVPGVLSVRNEIAVLESS